MKMMKRALAWMLVVVMVLTCLPSESIYAAIGKDTPEATVTVDDVKQPVAAANEFEFPEWGSSETQYAKGDIVKYNNELYIASGTASNTSWESWAWKKLSTSSECSAWDSGTWGYSEWTCVKHNGKLYVATGYVGQGKEPGTDSLWVAYGTTGDPIPTTDPNPSATPTPTPSPSPSPTPSPTPTASPSTTPGQYEQWDASKSYSGGTIVEYEGKLYKAKYYAEPGYKPGENEVWEEYSENPTETPTPTEEPTPTPTPTPGPVEGEIRAEFYMVTAPTDCRYTAWAGDFELFNETSPSYVGSSSIMIDDTNVALDLLEDPFKTFGVENEPGTAWRRIRNTKASSLYEVRSSRRAKLTSTNVENSTQWVYASKNAEAKNYIDGEWNMPESAVAIPTIPGATLYASGLDDTRTIKYIYLYEQKVSIEYYVLTSDGTAHPMTTIPGTMNTENFGIAVAPFVTDAQFADCDAKIAALDPESVTRANLNGKRMELYVDGALKKSFQTGVQDIFFATDSANTTFEGGEFVLKVYYGQPPKPTNNVIQMPITMYDFAADGMFFEFCSNTNTDMTRSYGYGLWNGTDEHNGQNLASETLMDDKDGAFGPRIQYTEAAIAFVANLINNGVMWNGVSGEGGDANDAKDCPDIPNYATELRTLIAAQKGNLGSYSDVTAALSDGEITKEEVTNSYLAAAYMMSHFFDEESIYNVKVPSDKINALQLREMSDGDTSYYVYDANWNSNVVDGVIQNTLGGEGLFTDATAPLPSAFYIPLDWSGYDSPNDRDQYEEANFLFSTVGQGKFIYNEEKNLYFTFKGDDDVYLYINGHLAVDLGGAHPALEGTINLNDLKDKLGLEENQVCDFTFFHMERHGTGSNFRMVTNIEITTPSMITDKNAYQNDVQKANGEIVSAGVPVVYEFNLTNDGELDMYNLAFDDQSLAVRLYSKGSALKNKLDGLADQLTVDAGMASAIGERVSNALKYADIVITIQEKNGDQIVYPSIDKYKFSWNESLASYAPDVDENLKAIVEEAGGFGSFDHVKLSDKYKALYGTEGTEEQLETLLQEILLNGIKVGQSITLKGFNRTLPGNVTFVNRLNTYGSDYRMREVRGTGSTKVRTIETQNVVKVIDYGKKVTYGPEEIFGAQELSNTQIELNLGALVTAAAQGTWSTANGSSAGESTAKNVNTYGNGYFWGDNNFTYELTKFMNGVDTFQFRVTGRDDNGNLDMNESQLKSLDIVPASVMYYEDNFNSTASTNDSSSKIIYDGAAAAPDASDAFEQDSNAGTNVNDDASMNGDQQYGYDQNYAADGSLKDSNGTSVLLKDGNTAEFTFKGTGFDVVGRSTTTSTMVYYKVKNSAGKLVRFGAVDTFYANGALYQTPVLHVELNSADTYTVTISVGKSGINEAGEFYLDGVRIYNPLSEAESDQYYLDSEKNAQVTKLNEMLIGDCTITENSLVDVDGISVRDVNIPGATAAVLDVFADDDFVELATIPVMQMENLGSGNEGLHSSDSLLQYLKRGHNNEVYLDDTAGVAFVAQGDPTDSASTLQLEVQLADLTSHALDKAAGTLQYLKSDGTMADMATVSSATAMYYEVPVADCYQLEDGRYLVVVKGFTVEDSIIAGFTNLKVSGYTLTSPLDDANADVIGDLIIDYGEESVLLINAEPWDSTIRRGQAMEANVSISDELYEVLKDASAAELLTYFSIQSDANAGKVSKAYMLGTLDENGNHMVAVRFKAPNARGTFPITVTYKNGTVEESISFSLLISR